MMITSEYNRDQLEALVMVRQYLDGLSRSQVGQIKQWSRHYLRFRADVAAFHRRHFAEICTRKCFTSQTSACCNRDGIITFFADVVINVLQSSDRDIDDLLQTLYQDRGGVKCVYLKRNGCLWRLKPIVCEMFLCEYARESVFKNDNGLQDQWKRLRRRERRYTWPSRPVLFDKLEEIFIQAGYNSTLMYLHHSPGLLRVKDRFLKNRSRDGRVT